MTPANTLPYDQLLEVRRTGVCPTCFVPVSPQGVGAHARGKLHREAGYRRALEARGYKALDLRAASHVLLPASPVFADGTTLAPDGLIRFLRKCGIATPEIGPDVYIPASLASSASYFLPPADWARLGKRLKEISRKAQHDQDEIFRAADAAVRLGASVLDALGVKP